MVYPSRVSGCAPKAGAYARSLFMVEGAADDAPYGGYLAGSGARPWNRAISPSPLAGILLEIWFLRASKAIFGVWPLDSCV